MTLSTRTRLNPGTASGHWSDSGWPLATGHNETQSFESHWLSSVHRVVPVPLLHVALTDNLDPGRPKGALCLLLVHHHAHTPAHVEQLRRKEFNGGRWRRCPSSPTGTGPRPFPPRRLGHTHPLSTTRWLRECKHGDGGGGATKKASRTNQGWAPGPTLRVNVRIVVFTGWVRTPRAVTVHDHWWTRRGWGNGTLGPHPCCLPLPLTRHVGLGREAAKSARHT